MTAEIFTGVLGIVSDRVGVWAVCSCLGGRLLMPLVPPCGPPDGSCGMSVASETIDWFSDSTNWSGDYGMPHRLVQHLGYTGLTVVIAAALASRSACGSVTRDTFAAWPPCSRARCARSPRWAW